jgi:hypothetical protein
MPHEIKPSDSDIESASPRATLFDTFSDSDSESETATFSPALIQILNTYIYLAIGKGFANRLPIFLERASDGASLKFVLSDREVWIMIVRTGTINASAALRPRLNS